MSAVLEKTNGKLTDEQLAFQSGISRRTLRTYRIEGCDAATPAEVRKWRDENKQRTSPSREERKDGTFEASIGLDEEEQRAKIAKLREEERKLKLANDEREGQLLDSEDAELAVSELTGLVRNRIESIPGQIEPELPESVRALVTELLKDKFNLILTEMSQWRLTNGE